MSGWYVKRDDKKYGPYSSPQLVEMAKKGQVLPIDWVAQGEGEKWMPASQVKGLFAAPAAAPPPLLPAAVTPSAPPPLGAKAHRPFTPGIPPPQDFTNGPPPLLPSGRTGGTSVEIVDSTGNRTNPARITPPIVGMSLIVGLEICLSVFEAIRPHYMGDFGLRDQLLVAFSLFHCVFAAFAIVKTVQMKKRLFAPLASILTMTACGWYCFATIPTFVLILGLGASISVGIWALFTLHSPEAKTMFADAEQAGPLDRFSTPVLAAVGGAVLASILAIGGLIYLATKDKSRDFPDHNYFPDAPSLRPRLRK